MGYVIDICSTHGHLPPLAVGSIADVSEVHASSRVDPEEACLCLLLARLNLKHWNFGELLPDYTASYPRI
jgi:hypothetical protein